MCPEAVTDPLAKLAYSIHPTTAGILAKEKVPQLLTKLQEYLKHPKVVALAEVGLDFEKIHLGTKFSNWIVSLQEYVLKQQLMAAKVAGKPVTIHLYDHMFQEDAVNQCLEILKSTLPSDWPIYWHCFLGDVSQYR